MCKCPRQRQRQRQSTKGHALPEHGRCCRLGRSFDVFECSPEGAPRCCCTCVRAGGGQCASIGCVRTWVWHELGAFQGARKSYYGASSPPGTSIFSPPGSRFCGFSTLRGEGWCSAKKGQRQRQRQRQSNKGHTLPEHGICCRVGRPFDAFECSAEGAPRCCCTCVRAGGGQCASIGCAKTSV